MTEIIKVNDSLYKAFKNGVWFVMERLVPGDEERINFWIKFIDEEEYYNRRYLYTYYNMEENNEEWPLKEGFIPVERRGSNVIAGLSMFKDVIKDFRKHSELWVAFVSLVDVNNIEEIIYDNIEMYVSVITDPDFPITTHMGINRSTKYLFDAINKWRKEKINILHRNLSMTLHSFAAKVINTKYNDKLYMITAPATEMFHIFQKTFPR